MCQKHHTFLLSLKSNLVCKPPSYQAGGKSVPGITSLSLVLHCIQKANMVFPSKGRPIIFDSGWPAQISLREHRDPLQSCYILWAFLKIEPGPLTTWEVTDLRNLPLPLSAAQEPVFLPWLLSPGKLILLKNKSQKGRLGMDGFCFLIQQHKPPWQQRVRGLKFRENHTQMNILVSASIS